MNVMNVDGFATSRWIIESCKTIFDTNIDEHHRSHRLTKVMFTSSEDDNDDDYFDIVTTAVVIVTIMIMNMVVVVVVVMVIMIIVMISSRVMTAVQAAARVATSRAAAVRRPRWEQWPSVRKVAHCLAYDEHLWNGIGRILPSGDYEALTPTESKADQNISKRTSHCEGWTSKHHQGSAKFFLPGAVFATTKDISLTLTRKLLENAHHSHESMYMGPLPRLQLWQLWQNSKQLQHQRRKGTWTWMLDICLSTFSLILHVVYWLTSM